MVIATLLDQEMLEARAVTPFSRLTPVSAMPTKTGAAVFTELGGRFLLKYLADSDPQRYAAGTTEETFLTPTAVPVHDAATLLALPAPERRRRFVLVIDPRVVQDLRGPRWIRLGMGLEYVLPVGFGAAALVPPGWPVTVG
jgi:hypothetical protein